MNREELFDVLRPIILSTGVPEVVLYDPDMDAPAGEYASVEPFQSITPRLQGGQQRTDLAAGVLNAGVKRDLEVVTAINFYRGTDPANYARLLIGCEALPDNGNRLFTAGVRWMETGRVNDLTGLLGSQYQAERRARVEVRLMVPQVLSAVLNRVESADVIIVDEANNEIGGYSNVS